MRRAHGRGALVRVVVVKDSRAIPAVRAERVETVFSSRGTRRILCGVLAGATALVACGGEDERNQSAETGERSTTSAPATTTTTAPLASLTEYFSARIAELTDETGSDYTQWGFSEDEIEYFSLSCGDSGTELMDYVSGGERAVRSDAAPVFRKVEGAIAATEIVCPRTAERIRSLIADGYADLYQPEGYDAEELQDEIANFEYAVAFLSDGYPEAPEIPATFDDERAVLFFISRATQAGFRDDCDINHRSARAIREVASGQWVVADDDGNEVLVTIDRELITSLDGGPLPIPYSPSCDRFPAVGEAPFD